MKILTSALARAFPVQSGHSQPRGPNAANAGPGGAGDPLAKALRPPDMYGHPKLNTVGAAAGARADEPVGVGGARWVA